MVNVFNDRRYAIQYEQFELDTKGFYKFAEALINLANIPPGSKTLELGSGTGVSTCRLFDRVDGIDVTGVDKSPSFMRLASLKFGLLGDKDVARIFQDIRENHPYPQLMRDRCEVKDLEAHLRKTVEKYTQHQDKVRFYNYEASQIDQLQEQPFDYVIASQVFHWFRRTNQDYEDNVMQQIRAVLKDHGRFAFNTTGADFRFDEQELNEKHMLNHPFYKSFRSHLYDQLGRSQELQKSQEHIFNPGVIEQSMRRNGFRIIGVEKIEFLYELNKFIEACLLGGHMQIFQKGGLSMDIKERERIITGALDYAMSSSPPEQQPIVETGINYFVEKI